jgi:hypothetical protein
MPPRPQFVRQASPSSGSLSSAAAAAEARTTAALREKSAEFHLGASPSGRSKLHAPLDARFD